MRVVIDTNVLISSLLSPTGTPAKIIEAWQREEFDLVISPTLLEEFGRVFSYDKIDKVLRLKPNEKKEILDGFAQFAIVVKPTKKVTVIKNDPDDNRVLEAAEKGEAEFIVSGDPDLLQLKEYKSIQILTPAAFVLILNNR